MEEPINKSLFRDIILEYLINEILKMEKEESQNDLHSS